MVLDHEGTFLKAARKKKPRVRLLVGRISATTTMRMRAVRSKNTAPEVLLRRALFARGLRYRTHVKTLPGKPDIVLGASKIVVFCDGDFWHGRGWGPKQALKFKVRRRFWVNKISRNVARDKRTNNELKRMGWIVLRVWASDVIKDPDRVANSLCMQIQRKYGSSKVSRCQV